MPAVGPMLRAAAKWGPVALEVTRQLDRQIRPHVLAYRLARDVDGYVGRWGSEDGTHWVVFAEREGAPAHAFPSLDARELERAARELDRDRLRHHSALPEARARDAGVTVWDTALGLRDSARQVPSRVTGRLRRH